MVLQGIDPIGQPLPHEAIFLEGRNPLILAEQARALNLDDGQVVQATVAPGGQSLNLRSAGLTLALPPAWGWEAGRSYELVSSVLPNGNVMLRPLQPSVRGEPPSALRISPQAQSTPAPLSLGQAFAAALAGNLLPGVPVAPGVASETARLLAQTPAWTALLGTFYALGRTRYAGAVDPMFSQDTPVAEEAADPAGTTMTSELTLQWLRSTRQLAGLSPMELREVMRLAGAGTEALLLQHMPGIQRELRNSLRRLLLSAAEPADGAAVPLARQIQRALDDLQRMQLDALSSHMQGQLMWSMVLPFGDAGPVALRLFRDRCSEDDPNPAFVVDVHSRHTGLGPVWLRTVILQNNRVGLTMWAERSDVAVMAREQVRDLRLHLTQGGLKLDHFEVRDGACPSEDDPFASGRA